MASDSYLTISEVVAQLGTEYPDLSVSKLRYLEDEGLVSPARTPGGYRKYSDENIARIQTILQWQSEHFLPLSVIKERLEQIEEGEGSDVDKIAENPHEEFRASLQNRILLKQIHTELGVTDSFIQDLAKTGLITIRTGKSGEYIDGVDAEIAVDAWELKSFGVDPRHLKMYAYLSQKEADFFEQILSPAYRIRTDVSAKRLDEALREIGKVTTSLKSRLAQKALYGRLKGLL
ncbi:MAG: MerR family transcriptional regulator [Coriobacteriia bacterium]|nr:MerR family transcriptional regulator [Coriobacteriia bacterium]